jgi:plasmid stabilization system protein ParE
MGRVGAEPGIRELVIGGTPYVVLYSVKKTQVTITTIWHGAQSRKTSRQEREDKIAHGLARNHKVKS